MHIDEPPWDHVQYIFGYEPPISDEHGHVDPDPMQDPAECVEVVRLCDRDPPLSRGRLDRRWHRVPAASARPVGLGDHHFHLGDIDQRGKARQGRRRSAEKRRAHQTPPRSSGFSSLISLRACRLMRFGSRSSNNMPAR